MALGLIFGGCIQARSQDLEKGGAILKKWEVCKRPWLEISLLLNQFHTVCTKVETKFLGNLGNSKLFSAQIQVVSEKKGLHRFWDWFFGRNRKIEHLRGGCFPIGGAIFNFSPKIGLKSTKKRAILNTLQANGGGYSPPAPPGYAIGCIILIYQKMKLQSKNYEILNKQKLRKKIYIYLPLTCFLFRNSLTTIYSRTIISSSSGMSCKSSVSKIHYFCLPEKDFLKRMAYTALKQFE